MYKNLGAAGLGVSGRQSELIELALTYGFRGFDVDMERLAKQAQRNSLEHAGRFIESAASFANGFSIGGWDLGLPWDEDDAAFSEGLGRLDEFVEVAAKVDASRCFTTIQPASDTLPYHENFERLRSRIGQAAAKLAAQQIRLGLNFRPAPEVRADRAHEFIHDFEGLTTLASTIGAANVGIVLDTWNWFVGGGGLDQLNDLSAEQIVIVRIADVPGDADLAAIGEKQRILPSDEGLVDCDAVMKLLLEKDYDGPITPYPHPSAFTGRTRESIVQAAADCLEQLWIAVGLSKPKAALVAVGASVNGEAGADDDKDSGKDKDSNEDKDSSGDKNQAT